MRRKRSGSKINIDDTLPRPKLKKFFLLKQTIYYWKIIKGRGKACLNKCYKKQIQESVKWSNKMLLRELFEWTIELNIV